MSPEMKAILFMYICAVSLTSIFVTIYDKQAAKKYPRHRIRERTLLWLAALGGSLCMYVTMLLIRHKTLHRKFTVGLPLIILLQTAVCTFFYLKFF